RYTRRSVEGTLPFLFLLRLASVEASVRVRAGVEQRGRRADEAIGPRGFESEELREAEIGERVPLLRAPSCRSARAIVDEEPANGDRVAENRRGIERVRRDFRVRSENRRRRLQRPMPE